PPPPPKGEPTRSLVAELRKALHLRPKSSCEDCVDEAKDFFDLASENSTTREIESAFDDVCGDRYRKDPDAAHECEVYVDQSAPKSIEGVVDNFPPTPLCRELKFCPVP